MHYLLRELILIILLLPPPMLKCHHKNAWRWMLLIWLFHTDRIISTAIMNRVRSEEQIAEPVRLLYWVLSAALYRGYESACSC